jgi:Serine-pyruvate aminotransferase/archaeal aspartate aminotransferase
MILEEGLQNVFKRHKVCSNALYSGLSAMGLSPFAKEEDRSISIVALNTWMDLKTKLSEVH